MWQKREGSKVVSRIVRAHWRYRRGSAIASGALWVGTVEPLPVEREVARDGQGIVMERQGAWRRQRRWEGRRKIRRVESG